MKHSILVLLIGAMLFSIQSTAQTILEMSSTDAREIIEAPHGEGFQLIDARTIEMFNSGHIRSAIVIDANQDNLKEKLLPYMTKDTLFLYCNTHNRIQKIKDALLNNGYQKVMYLMTDGITGWKEQGFDLEIPENETDK